MRRSCLHSVTPWLCLFAFMANMVFQAGIVLCSDGHGGSRLEWTCSQNEQRECVKACGPGAGTCQEKDPLPHPCEDKPLALDQGQVHQAPPQANQPSLPVPALIAVIEPFRLAPLVTCQNRPLRPVSRPPDVLGRLRSVILTV